MIFLINNQTTIWVTIHILNKAHFQTHEYPYISALYLCIIVVSTLFIFRSCYIMWRYQVFHINLRILFIVQMLEYYQFLAAKLIMFPYMSGTRLVGDPKEIYDHYWTTNVAEMVPIKSIWDEFPLFLASFLQTQSHISQLFFLFSVTIERAVASYYLSDYEAESRLHIGIILIIGSFIFCCLMSTIFALNMFTFVVYYSVAAIFTILSILLYTLVWYYNMGMKVVNPKLTKVYTLARRFQTAENIRSLKMVKKVIAVHTAYVFTLLAIQTTSYFFMHNYMIWKTAVYSLDTVIMSSPLIICPVTILAVGVWKRAALKHFQWFCWGRRKIHTLENSSACQMALAKNNTETYFGQLNKAWE